MKRQPAYAVSKRNFRAAREEKKSVLVKFTEWFRNFLESAE